MNSSNIIKKQDKTEFLQQLEHNYRFINEKDILQYFILNKNESTYYDLKIDHTIQFNFNDESKHQPKKSLKEIKITDSSNKELQKNSSIDIQRVWRGYRIRKEIALILPSLLTHSMKLKLYGGNKSPLNRKEIENKLFAVHSTNYFPTNGIIHVVDPKARGGSYFRPTTHFSLGELVQPHSDNKASWENKKFAIITPLKDLLPQLLSLNFYDTHILGHFKLTKDSIILVPEDEVKQYDQYNLKIVSYNTKNMTLRQAIKSLVIKQGGYDVVTFPNQEELSSWGPAFISGLQSDNLNTPQFFAPILRQQRHTAFGGHSYTLFGSSYLIGIVDNALTQLGFSPDYYGNTYNEDPAFAKLIIEYALKKIESNPIFLKNHAGSDILKLHLIRAREGLQQLAINSERKSFDSDYAKARIACTLTWSDLFNLMQINKHHTLNIHNIQAFLCMYAFNRTHAIGEQDAAKEGLMTVFSHHLNRLDADMRIQIIGTILSIRSNMNHNNKSFPGGISYLRQLLTHFGKSVGIAINPADNLDTSADKIWKTLRTQQRLQLPTQKTIPRDDNNAPLIQALLARDEQKALNLLIDGANITNVYGRVPGWEIPAPLLTIALRCGMSVFADFILKRPDFLNWDQLDGWNNTPLCDAIVMGLEDIAVYLIKRGANITIRPNYANVPEKNLLDLAERMGLTQVATLLREHSNISHNTSKSRCTIM